MKRPDLIARKILRAKGIAERCNLAGVKPPAWVRYLLDPKKQAALPLKVTA